VIGTRRRIIFWRDQEESITQKQTVGKREMEPLSEKNAERGAHEKSEGEMSLRARKGGEG